MTEPKCWTFVRKAPYPTPAPRDPRPRRAYLKNPEPRSLTCRVTDCGSAPFGRGYCVKHYTRMRKFGTTDARFSGLCEVCNERLIDPGPQQRYHAGCARTAQKLRDIARLEAKENE